MRSFALAPWLAARRAEVDALLDGRLPAPPPGADPGRLVEAMRYSLLAPGKRLRPVLALGAAEATAGSASEPVRIAAAAVELVHCYSLVHDDLPAMDDDDYRRGRPTSHKMFGEATAILAGDALLTLAFEWLAEAGLQAQKAAAPGDFLRASAALSRGAGMYGMVRGQARDLGDPPPSTLVALEVLHAEKTAALFRAALEVGAWAAGGAPDEVEAMGQFGQAYGIAFQHADDAQDEEHGELRAEAAARVEPLIRQALTALDRYGARAEPLRALARALAL